MDLFEMFKRPPSGLPEGQKFLTDPEKFRYNEFLDYYDRMSEQEWEAVIRDMQAKGYDIRCVLHYKREMGDRFSIESIREVADPLFCADNCPMTDLCFEDMEWESHADQYRRDISERYARFGLPIPAYWREKLWPVQTGIL